MLQVEGVSYFENTGNTCDESTQINKSPDSCLDHSPQFPRSSYDAPLNEVGDNKPESNTSNNGCVNSVEFAVEGSIQSTTLRFEVD